MQNGQKYLEGILPQGEKDFVMSNWIEMSCFSTASGQELKEVLNRDFQPCVSTSGGSVSETCARRRAHRDSQVHVFAE